MTTKLKAVTAKVLNKKTVTAYLMDPMAIISPPLSYHKKTAEGMSSAAPLELPKKESINYTLPATLNTNTLIHQATNLPLLNHGEST